MESYNRIKCKLLIYAPVVGVEPSQSLIYWGGWWDLSPLPPLQTRKLLNPGTAKSSRSYYTTVWTYVKRTRNLVVTRRGTPKEHRGELPSEPLSDDERLGRIY